MVNDKAILGMGGYFSNPTQHPELITRFAYNNGIRFFDTSPAYGESETHIGNALRGFKRTTYSLSTKTKSKTKEGVWKDFVESTEKLGVVYLDIYFGHDFINSLDEWESSCEALKEMLWLKQNNFIKSIGVSGHSAEAAIKAIDCGIVDWIMIPHSIMFRAFEDIILYAKEKNVKVITMKNFGSGILLGGDVNNSYKEDVPLKDIISFNAWFPGVDVIIPAYRSNTQLTQTQIAYHESEPLDEVEVMNIIKKIQNHLGDNFCRFCNLCRPCDVHGWQMSQPGILKSMIYDKVFNSKMKKTYDSYKKNYSDCTGCDDLCSKRCPFGINIKESLGMADQYFQLGGN